MKSIIPITANSLKTLRSYLKSVPNKIYSVEIKIKTENASSSTELPTVSETVDPNNLQSKQTTSSNATTETKMVDKKSKPKSLSNDVLLKKLSQIERIKRTEKLVNSLKHSWSIATLPNAISLNIRLKQLYDHLQTYPEASNLAVRKNILSKLLKIREFSQFLINGTSISEWLKLPQKRKSSSQQINQTRLLHKNYHRFVNENSRQIISLLGHADPPKGRGIRVLSIDGGGTRGLLVIEILRQIERQYGQPIHKIFDLICGVSTGAIIAMLLGALRIPIDECESYYRQVSSYLFKTDVLRGTGRLLWSHAYYDTNVYEKILKQIYGDIRLIHTKKSSDCPHMVVISAIVNLPTLEPYLFRNYELHPSSKPLSHFDGGSMHRIWEAVRASSAAPGYFEEFTLDKHVHQDGGILLNNPTAVALHEAKLLWPNEQIQCVISLGSGRYQPPSNRTIESHDNKDVTLSSLKHKILRLIDSATDTEMIHRLMQDMLPNQVYYRMNPMLTDYSTIDENRPEKLEQMKQDAQIYLRKNEHKFRTAIEQLKLERSHYQSLKDRIHLQSKVYWPF
ncbi:calcium-independent phospholipase a2-gamma-like protein [Dermatophagoides farinae]|uniref:Calcium-independent phospholipase a2-gamma-like protein n=1 Tax=Dermatophagoides farinae TaxID=6954 RepID=A0A9D4NZY9_DERFA|nr:calcium-independent phospholipase A2-gamma-like [Dermatophagoides farinae]KAH7641398.1 calcium-independent phospholipase a2-gamma-like protein [Dermatophagoides farinae]